jgi:hypothetical protein
MGQFSSENLRLSRVKSQRKSTDIHIPSGRIIDRSHEAQQYRASGLNLVIAAIVYWNTIYMDAAAQHLRSAAVPVPDGLLARPPRLAGSILPFPAISSGIVQPLPLDARPSISRRIAA